MNPKNIKYWFYTNNPLARHSKLIRNYFLCGLFLQVVVILILVLQWINEIKINEGDFKEIWYSSLTYYTQQCNVLFSIIYIIYFFKQKLIFFKKGNLLCCIAAYAAISLVIFNSWIIFNIFHDTIKFDHTQQNILIFKRAINICQYVFFFEINPIFMISLFIVNAKYNNYKKQITKNKVIKSFFCWLIYPFCYLIYVLIVPFLTCGADHRNFSVYGNFTNCCPNCFYQKNKNDPSSSEIGRYSNIINIFILFLICIVVICLFLSLKIKFYSNKINSEEKDKRIKLDENINDYLWKHKKILKK